MRVLRTVLVLSLLLGISFAQGLLVTGGVTYSTIDGKDVEEDELGLVSSIGLILGVDKEINNGLFAGVGYVQRGYGMDISEEFFGETITMEGSFALNYLSAHVYKVFPVNMLQLYGGLELGYFLSAKSKIEMSGGGETESQEETIDASDWKDDDGTMLDYGVLAGVRYPVNEQISVSLSYVFGLADLAKDSEVANRSIQITAGYTLP